MRQGWRWWAAWGLHVPTPHPSPVQGPLFLAGPEAGMVSSEEPRVLELGTLSGTSAVARPVAAWGWCRMRLAAGHRKGRLLSRGRQEASGGHLPWMLASLEVCHLGLLGFPFPCL